MRRESAGLTLSGFWRAMLAGRGVQARVGETQPLDGLSSDDVFGDDFIDVGCGHAAVPDSFRINDDIGTVLALVKASSLVRADATLES